MHTVKFNKEFQKPKEKQTELKNIITGIKKYSKKGISGRLDNMQEFEQLTEKQSGRNHPS